MINVALIYPEMYDLARFGERRKEFPPFGVMYLASTIEKTGLKVSIFSVNDKEFILDLRGYDIIGFSIPSSASYEIIKKSIFSSSYSKEKIITVGGVHASIYPEETLIDLNPDIVVVGNGEETILEIIKNFSGRDFSQIKGICYLQNKKIIKNHQRLLERNIDWLPFPSRHLLPENDFIMKNRLANTTVRMTHVMLTRGCPFSCHFCAVLQKKVQYRTAQNIKEELQHLKSKYHIEGFAITDDNFIVNKKMVKNFCLAIKDLDLKWSALSRVDTVDYETLDLMHESGCIEIKFGVESGSMKILSAMGKNISIEQIKNAINLADSAGMMVKIFLIHGFPGENMLTTEETIELLSEIKPKIDRVSLFRFVPLPGSYVFNNPEKFNLKISNPKKWDKYHIYNNDYHWWGDDSDFKEMCAAYYKLKLYISNNWPEKF
jgi:radical SAM superfamily enzyme YgiQ (UPF0313 family)